MLLSLPELKIPAAGENIFSLLDSELHKYTISWDQCVEFSADNASVMTGVHKGVISYIWSHQSV